MKRGGRAHVKWCVKRIVKRAVTLETLKLSGSVPLRQGRETGQISYPLNHVVKRIVKRSISPNTDSSGAAHGPVFRTGEDAGVARCRGCSHFH
jgi:hypothetical protein